MIVYVHISIDITYQNPKILWHGILEVQRKHINNIYDLSTWYVNETKKNLKVQYDTSSNASATHIFMRHLGYVNMVIYLCQRIILHVKFKWNFLQHFDTQTLEFLKALTAPTCNFLLAKIQHDSNVIDACPWVLRYDLCPHTKAILHFEVSILHRLQFYRFTRCCM